VKRPVILYGPPAVGKDTITRALIELDPEYRLFPLLKVGGGKLTGYRMVSIQQLTALDLILSWHRYGNTYAIDSSGLSEALRTHSPVLHLGSPERVQKVLSHKPDMQWLVVEMTCPRAVAKARLTERNADDVADRLRIFDQTPPLPEADLQIDTSRSRPTQAANRILERAQAAPARTSVRRSGK
jgi:guanylate kinase